MSSPFHAWRDHLPLARERWFVVRQQGRWKVRHGEFSYGPYYAQAGALRAAVDEAHKAGCNGAGAQVFVQVEGDEFKLEWTYGLDQYPPQD